jgi:hypothetical protein
MSQNRLVIGAIVVIFMGLIGFMLPQHLGGVQKLQSVFILADEQLIFSNECSAAALGNLPQVKGMAPPACSPIIRAREIYAGLSYSEALAAFKSNLLQDQYVFSCIAAGFGAFLYLLIVLGGAYRPKRKELLLKT